MVHIIGQGESTDPMRLALQTRRRWHIPNELRDLEKAPDSRQAGVKLVADAHRSTRVLCSSALYNCAGLVFGSRRVWIDIEHAERILQDDGYRVMANRALWRAGDVVLYRYGATPSHVGLIHDVVPDPKTANYNVTVVSSWGETGEFLHDWRDVSPLLGHPEEVWSKRVLA